jgi:hypothetical protein
MIRYPTLSMCLLGLAGPGSSGNLECGPTSVDLGVVSQGRVVTLDRSCQNTGTRELVVRNIRTGCTCLTARLDKSVLGPGERSRLRLQLETNPLADKIEFAVELPYAGKDASTEILSVTADVRPSVVAVPEYLDMGDFRKSGARQFLVVDTTGRAFTVRQVSTARAEVEVRWAPVELVRMGDKWETSTRGGAVTGYQVTVQIRPGSTRHSLSDEIQIDLGHELQKSLRVRIVGYSP